MLLVFSIDNIQDESLQVPEDVVQSDYREVR